MGHTHQFVHGQSARASRINADDDYAASMVGVGGAYHTTVAWRALAEESFHPSIPGNRWSEKTIPKPLEEHERKTLTGDHEMENALRKTQEELRELSLQLLTIQECERQRIAADLHDGLGQSLTLIKLSMESAIYEMRAGAYREAEKSFEQTVQRVRDTMAELRRTTMDLRPSMLDDLGIVPALSCFFREFETGWKGKKIEKDISITEGDVRAALKTPIFRILQEAMNNIAKHAQADRIQVSLKMDGCVLRLAIEDNGRGFDATNVAARQGLDRGIGLLTMRERARCSGGAFEVRSAPGLGTHIYASWQCTA